ncbi:hypothetical protein [Staphylococcus schweitzeri]|uniref:hypothetical protein n=1 Tax=Staphylococcus schweitzeri TaxID=1654388 RepID=UPI001749412F|nr:hypothetical protein [Staphylococcus schweitzeri]
MRVSAENPPFGTPLIGFPEHKNFMSQPLLFIKKISKYRNTCQILIIFNYQTALKLPKLLILLPALSTSPDAI